MMCAVQCYVPQLNLISALEVVKCVRDDIKLRCENMTEKYVQKLTADFVSSNNVGQRPKRTTMLPSAFGNVVVTEPVPSANSRRPIINTFRE